VPGAAKVIEKEDGAELAPPDEGDDQPAEEPEKEAPPEEAAE
jgi:hypothetical protein